MVFLACIFFGEGIPEAVELVEGHVEDVLNPLHRCIHLAYLEEVPDARPLGSSNIPTLGTLQSQRGNVAVPAWD